MKTPYRPGYESPWYDKEDYIRAWLQEMDFSDIIQPAEETYTIGDMDRVTWTVEPSVDLELQTARIPKSNNTQDNSCGYHGNSDIQNWIKWRTQLNKYMVERILSPDTRGKVVTEIRRIRQHSMDRLLQHQKVKETLSESNLESEKCVMFGIPRAHICSRKKSLNL